MQPARLLTAFGVFTVSAAARFPLNIELMELSTTSSLLAAVLGLKKHEYNVFNYEPLNTIITQAPEDRQRENKKMWIILWKSETGLVAGKGEFTNLSELLSFVNINSFISFEVHKIK